MESTAAGYSQSKCVMNHARYVEPASCIHIQFGRVAQGRVPQIDLSSLTYTIHRSFASSCKQDRVVVVCHANTLRSGHGFSTDMNVSVCLAGIDKRRGGLPRYKGVYVRSAIVFILGYCPRGDDD